MLPDFIYKCITICITKNISKQTSLYHHKAKNQLRMLFYRRAFKSFANSSNPGLPNKANMLRL